jgi:hypothetical protein
MQTCTVYPAPHCVLCDWGLWDWGLWHWGLWDWLQNREVRS